MVAKPLCLSEVRDKVDRSGYESMAAFEADLKLIVNNAKRFNAVGSRLYLDAEAIEKVARALPHGRAALGHLPQTHNCCRPCLALPLSSFLIYFSVVWGLLRFNSSPLWCNWHLSLSRWLPRRWASRRSWATT